MKHNVWWAYDLADLGNTVRRARRESGMTQLELAERLGVTRMTLSRLEHGEAVSMDTAMRSLSECGYAVAIAPKFSTLTLDNPRLVAPDATAETDAAGARGEDVLDG